LQRHGGRRHGNHLLLLLGDHHRHRVAIETARRCAAEPGEDAVNLNRSKGQAVIPATG